MPCTPTGFPYCVGSPFFSLDRKARSMAKRKIEKKATEKTTTTRKANTKAAKKTRRRFTPKKKAKIIAAVDAAPRGSKEKLYKRYGVLRTQVSGWRTKGFGKKTRATRKTTTRRVSFKSKNSILAQFQVSKKALLSRKAELESELKQIVTALKA